MKPYYLKIAIRNALKNGTLTFAKLFGLSVSFAVILFALGYVYFETSFDKCVPDHDRIYRCLMEGRLNNEDVSFSVTSPREGPTLIDEIPEITEAIRILYQDEALVRYKNQDIAKEKLFYADSGFFSFFGFPIKTSYNNPLASKNYLVIAKSLAEKHFGSTENALDKVVNIRGEDCTITGVYDDFPRNFHLKATLIQSLQRSNPDSTGWGSQSYYTYFKTDHPVSDIDALNFRISKTVYLHSNEIDASKAKTLKDLKYTPDIYIFYTAEPLTAIHFSRHKFDPAITANRMYVYGAVVFALLILLISSINFINLTMANISTRLKDIGIRKTTGARNNNILKQFLFESFIFLVAGFVLALFLFLSVEKPLVQYLNFNTDFSDFRLIEILAKAFSALLFFNLVVVMVPIVVISKKKILSLVKEEKTIRKNFSINDSFLLMQFVLSVLIILCSFITQKQINFMVNKDRGYDTRDVMMLDMWRMSPENRRSFIEDLKTFDAVQSVSTSDGYFGNDLSMNAAYFETQDEKNYFHTSVLPVDDEFPHTFNLKIKEGRFFEKDKKTDEDAAILNETAFRKYSGTGSVIDKTLLVGGKKFTIIGIVRDFNFRSLHHPIQPLVMIHVDNFGLVYVKIKNGKIAETLDIIQKLWKKYDIPFTFNYKFHDEVVLQHYVDDRQAKRLLLILSFISIAIACAGLYAISYFTIVRRTKEVGIRKVNGARVEEVMKLLNKEFLIWVFIAFLVACPVAWYVMHKWLQNFAYKTSLSWWVFAFAGILTLAIALITVSWQSWRAATKNPVEALRYE
jgi:putative ABC transport system permease protein